jgi:multicomponent Na+:H+ antiporter subunit G
VTEIVSAVLAIAGAALVALAGVGVVRFPDLYARMHAATKAPTMGFLLIAAAAAVALGEARAKLALAVALILVTAPVAAHLVGRAAYRGSGRRVRLDADDELAAAVDATADRWP